MLTLCDKEEYSTIIEAANRGMPLVREHNETLDGFLKLSKHEIITHAGRISAKTAELSLLFKCAKKWIILMLGHS